jgi:hypothetical protein
MKSGEKKERAEYRKSPPPVKREREEFTEIVRDAGT